MSKLRVMSTFSTYQSLLSDLISLKSISTDPAFAGEIQATADWLMNLFTNKGFETKLFTGFGNPVVYASLVVDPKLETVLVYGHYDVQPASKEDGWETDPFTLSERAGRLYGRGVVDNKGQFMIHVVGVLEALRNKTLAYNVKFLIEGNEETGGAGIDRLIAVEKSAMAADYILISDGELPYKPVVTASFRGVFNATLKVTTATDNLHSGLFGGAVANAAEELARLIAKLNDDQYQSLIPGFYDGQVTMKDYEIAKCQLMDREKSQLFGGLGIKKVFGGEHQSFSAKIGFVTMLTVTGLKSGYIGEGYANIVPNYAEARINARIAAGHRAQDILQKLTQYLKEIAPDYLQIEVTDVGSICDPIKINVETKKHQEVFKMLAEVYGAEVLIDFCGAIVPIAGDFQKTFGVEPLLVSLGNDDCHMHGTNENFELGLVKKGLTFSEKFFTHNK